MLTMDVFRQDAFSATSLTAFVDRIGYVPGFLSSYPGLVTPQPIRTTDVFIEERDTTPALIQTTPRGAPPPQKGGDIRSVRSFRTTRIAQKSRITADELQNIRAAGSETEMKSLQTEIAQRQMKMKADMALTSENMLLGCVQGLVTDADGSTIYDWATQFSQTIPAEVDFDLDATSPASGILRKRCTDAVRSITRGLKGIGGNAVRVVALCGDDFWDLLIQHTEVRQTYLNYQAASALRDAVAWETFSFGGITWTNYRGTDDASTVAVGAAKAKFFPVGAPIFKKAMAPAETFDFVNTLGQDTYSWVVTDKDRNAWADIELYSYPLYVCTMPQALYRARMT